ncbi:MAG: POTRA domain-containing protein, partial [Halanaerobacter sp.]
MKRKLLAVNFALILIILLNCTALAAQSQEINNKVKELAGKEVTAIEIKGNKVVDDEEVLKEIETTVSSSIDPEKLKKDLQAIFDLGYFFDVQVLFEEEQDGLKVIFEVIENPEIEKIKIEGNQHLSKSKIKDILGFKLPEVLNVNQLNQSMKDVNQYYREQGYLLASITDVTIKEDDELHLTINEGFINSIKIKGNDKTKDYVIRREMSTQAGEILNLEELREDINSLYRLGYFKSIIPEFKHLEDSNKVDVVIKVEEAKTGSFNVGAGYSSAAKFTGMINVEKDNLSGRGQKVNLNWEFGGERNNFEIGFYEPWALGTETSLDFNLYDKNETTEDDVDVSTEGGNVTIGRPLTSKTKGYLDLEYNTIKEEYDDGDSSSDNTMSLTLRTIRDTRDDIFKPRQGSRQEIAVKKSGLWGTTDYAKYRLDWRKYLPVSDEDSLAFRFKMATSEGDLPSSERYYLSSLDAVRGYNDDYYKAKDTTGDGSTDYLPEENGFIGESLVLANLEYRKKLWDNITGVTFLDVGNAFERDDFAIDNFNYSLGLGIRFDTPVGQ